MKDKRQTIKSRMKQQALADQVAAGGATLGWLPPQTEQEVATFESHVNLAALPLPKALQDAERVFEQTQSGGPEVIIFPQSTADMALARAARQCGRLTPEIEEAMRRDRKAAEDGGRND